MATNNSYNGLKQFLCQRHTTISQLKRNWSDLQEARSKVQNAFHPNVILSSERRNACIKRLKNCHATMGSSESAKTAAVLVPLCIYKDEIGLLYTLRSTKLNSNKGQVSFPGGMRDKSDDSFEKTALRETWEELNIPMESVDVWSRGNIIGRKHVHVMPVLGYIGQVDPHKLKINPSEVEEAFVVTLQSLCDPNHWAFTQFRNNYTLPAYPMEKHKIWGLTALITHIMLNALLPDVYQHKLKFLQPIEHYCQRKNKSSV